MYREPPKSDTDTVLFTCTTGVSPMILGLLAVGPLFLVGVGALTDAVGTMFLAALPFFAVSLLLFAARRTTVVMTRALVSRRFFGTRTFPLDAVVRLAVPHASVAGLAATSDSRLAAGLLLWDAKGALFIVPAQVPTTLLRGIVATALPTAMRHAEDLIASGGRYMDSDGFSGLDQTTLHGRIIGLLAPVSHAAPLDTVEHVNSDGRVQVPGATFMITAQDLVLCELLRKRGVNLDVPMALVLLLE